MENKNNRLEAVLKYDEIRKGTIIKDEKDFGTFYAVMMNRKWADQAHRKHTSS